MTCLVRSYIPQVINDVWENLAKAKRKGERKAMARKNKKKILRVVTRQLLVLRASPSWLHLYHYYHYYFDWYQVLDGSVHCLKHARFLASWLLLFYSVPSPNNINGLTLETRAYKVAVYSAIPSNLGKSISTQRPVPAKKQCRPRHSIRQLPPLRPASSADRSATTLVLGKARLFGTSCPWPVPNLLLAPDVIGFLCVMQVC